MNGSNILYKYKYVAIILPALRRAKIIFDVDKIIFSLHQSLPLNIFAIRYLRSRAQRLFDRIFFSVYVELDSFI